MTLSIKPRHKEEKKLLDKELVRRLNTDTVTLIVLTSCIGVATAIIVSLMPGFTLPPSSIEMSLPTTDLGSTSGFVMSSDGSTHRGCLSSHLQAYATDIFCR
jgi:hypothetical protein